MNMLKHTKLWLSAVLLGGMLIFAGCGDDDSGPAAIDIQGITAIGTDLTTGDEVTLDLNGTSSATDVPPDAVVTVTFSRPIDASQATSSVFTLNDGSEDAGLSVSADGSTAVITPAEELIRGTIYTLSISSALTGSDGGTFNAITRTFTTAGRKPAVVPQEGSLVVYLPFEGEVIDEGGHTVLNDDVTFAEDRFGNFDGAADFNGTTNYVGVEYGADMSNASTTVSYWVKLPSNEDYIAHVGNTTDGNVKQFVTFGIGGNNGTYHEWNRFTCCDLGYDIDVLKYYTNHVNSGSAPGFAGSHIEMKNEGNPDGDRVVEVDNVDWISDNTGQWMHIVTSWNASAHRKSFYINGVPSTVYELTPSDEFVLDDAIIDTEGIDADMTNNKNLYLGSAVPYWATYNDSDNTITPFRSDIPFAYKGQMDDFRMFSVALTDAEVLELYNAERP